MKSTVRACQSEHQWMPSPHVGVLLCTQQCGGSALPLYPLCCVMACYAHWIAPVLLRLPVRLPSHCNPSLTSCVSIHAAGTCARPVTGDRASFFNATMHLHEQLDLDVSADVLPRVPNQA